MKTTVIIAVFTGLCLMASTHAQTNQSKNQNQQTEPADTPAVEQLGFSIDFPGGTPAQLIEAMNKASGTAPNVIIPANVADVELPKFKFQNVTATQVFGALNMVLEEKGATQLRWLSEGTGRGASRVWTLVKMVRARNEACKVLFIGELLQAFPLDDINAAIRTSWDMLGKSSSATLKFHKETKLLIVKGTEEELKLVVDVLKSLEEAAVAKKLANSTK